VASVLVLGVAVAPACAGPVTPEACSGSTMSCF
jgi:hypothetical protein